MVITITSLSELKVIAGQIAGKLSGGEIIGLIGDLGAGKTTFSQFLAQALGVQTQINSPTFVIMKIYPAKSGNIKSVCHIDAYRLNSPSDLADLGVFDYLGQPDTVSLVEWADKCCSILPAHTTYLEIKIQEQENSRQLTISDQFLLAETDLA